MRKTFCRAIGVAAVAGLVTPALSDAAAGWRRGASRPRQQMALDLGIQVAPKGGVAARGQGRPSRPTRGWPTCRTSPTPTTSRGTSRCTRRPTSAPTRPSSPPTGACRGRGRCRRPFVHDEEEPAGTAGSNDTAPNAEPIAEFGTAAAKNPRVRILGELANLAGSHRRAPSPPTRTRARSRWPPTPASTAPARSARRPCSATAPTAARPATAATTSTSTRSTSAPASRSSPTPRARRPASTRSSASTPPTAPRSPPTTTAAPACSATCVHPGGRRATTTSSSAGYDFFGPLPDDPTDSGSGNGGADEGNYNLAISVAAGRPRLLLRPAPPR